MDSFSHDFTSSILIVSMNASFLYTRMPDPHMILTARNDTYVRLHPDKQLSYCSTALAVLQ
jgi:hypothetical protein